MKLAPLFRCAGPTPSYLHPVLTLACQMKPNPFRAAPVSCLSHLHCQFAHVNGQEILSTLLCSKCGRRTAGLKISLGYCQPYCLLCCPLLKVLAAPALALPCIRLFQADRYTLHQI